jgi:hypothetical protein
VVAERGTYQELKQQGGIFAKLLAEQNRYSPEHAGGKSIFRSAFIGGAGGAAVAVPDTVRASGSASVSAIDTVIVPATRSDKGSQPSLLPQTPQPQQPQQPPETPGILFKNARIRIELDGKIVGERKLDKPLMTIGRKSDNDVVECANGLYSHSGGVRGACSRDGGVARILYSH